MSKLPQCPKCQAEKLRGYDMSSLWFPEKEQCEKEGYQIGIDDYVYMDILCDACGHKFSEDFYTTMPPHLLGEEVKPKLEFTTGDNLALNVILQNLEPTSDLHKSLKKVLLSLGTQSKESYEHTPSIMKKERVEATYDVREVLKSVQTISYDEELTAELRKEYGTDFNVITACVKDNLIKPKALNLIKRLAPICYKINGKVFLKGETKGEYDMIGDDMDFNPLIELYDMTTEISTGDSYSFYVSSTNEFELATPEEIIKVKNFLKD